MTQSRDGRGGLRLWTGKVLDEWLDYNGHMTEHRYLQVFGESSDALYKLLGVDFASAESGAFYTLETHLRHLAECRLHTALWSETHILGHDGKRLHLWHELFDEKGALLATGEHLSIHVAHGRACEAPAAMQERMAALFTEQVHLPLPEESGRALRQQLVNMRARAGMSSANDLQANTIS